MRPLVKKTSLVLVVSAALTAASAVSPAQSGGSSRGAKLDATGQTLVLSEPGTIFWLERSEVAALREGVLEEIELQIGMPVKKGAPIGKLHREVAELTVKKNQLLADNVGAIKKAKAQREVAASKVARNNRLNARLPGAVSEEDMAKDEAEFKFADASLVEATEQQEVNKAELALAHQVLDEHTIRAPFDGIIIKRMKNPQESVRANEAVVELANLGKLGITAYVPLQYAYRVKEGQVVEIQPRLHVQSGEVMPIEKKRFRGKITFVDPQIQADIGEEVRIHAEFENPNLELRPGLRVQMTILLGNEVAAAAPGANNQ
jgi:RND family efflux transporter MFP subunit